MDDFLATFGARGDRDRASRIARRAELARDTRQLRELCYDGLRCCVPGMKLLLRALLALLRLPVTVPALAVRVGARLGRHLVVTLLAFAALALLAAYVGMVLAEHETAAAHAPVHRPPGASSAVMFDDNGESLGFCLEGRVLQATAPVHRPPGGCWAHRAR